ncbi:hypothetical protein ACH50_02725 [Franconibacter pulveris]|uniref:Uncharacterized protein n=1 Tax=Franconibacter pulveris TaxID=435910 RepID=A0A0J8YFP8_9ENTR|nr:hypothetical protein ACH50_02725 [Franconibacter pulveris]
MLKGGLRAAFFIKPRYFRFLTIVFELFRLPTRLNALPALRFTGRTSMVNNYATTHVIFRQEVVIPG